MAGKIVVSTLNNDTGVLQTQNGMTGIAKAWVNFIGSTVAGTVGTIRGSFNVSSVSVNGAGDYTINFTTAMPNANYVMAGSAMRDSPPSGSTNPVICSPYSGTTYSTAFNTTSIRIVTMYTGAFSADNNSVAVSVSIFSS